MVFGLCLMDKLDVPPAEPSPETSSQAWLAVMALFIDRSPYRLAPKNLFVSQCYHTSVISYDLWAFSKHLSLNRAEILGGEFLEVVVTSLSLLCNQKSYYESWNIDNMSFKSLHLSYILSLQSFQKPANKFSAKAWHIYFLKFDIFFFKYQTRLNKKNTKHNIKCKNICKYSKDFHIKLKKVLKSVIVNLLTWSSTDNQQVICCRGRTTTLPQSFTVNSTH